MERLQPLSKLDDDYYLGDGWREGDSDEELSSDDELQIELQKLAGIRSCDDNRSKCRSRSEFEDDMEGELDRSISNYTTVNMAGPSNPVLSTAMEVDDIKNSSDSLKNPIKQMANKMRKEREQEEVEFYDADEDEDNERWVSEHRQKSTGLQSNNHAKSKIDDDSDAVLSCPGCMNLLTRDCQRHEIYKDQYRAMFVENCTVDVNEKLKIAKSGKAERKKRQRNKKNAPDHRDDLAQNSDIFMPVRCMVCSTKVGVIDQDEVYHFFNVLTGYS